MMSARGTVWVSLMGLVALGCAASQHESIRIPSDPRLVRVRLLDNQNQLQLAASQPCRVRSGSAERV